MKKVMLCTYYFSLATIISNNPFCQRKCNFSGVSRVNVSVDMVTSSMVIVCCVSEHMILLSENKHFHNIHNIPQTALCGIALHIQRACMQKKQIFVGGWQFFLIICLLQAWHFLMLKATKRTTSGNLLGSS